ncbi:glucosylceramidase [Mucilaginibacter sp. PPCGB 2223]|uniref:glycoside hydrolase family 30 protein n=1 Tax=Mucilaginibacter sp. PPCGB 2223 TaxID=1886027 RepID=UPI0008265714|nr:glycoside hydrolase family 30 beta sandwich domain-containing protein [Mucilaginibacter sp. PPCGB 2223]OCX52497.1 glucosylceramidase [Mucilaginibacter sp. PPCGB 2223]
MSDIKKIVAIQRILAIFCILIARQGYAQKPIKADVWLTNPDRSALFTQQKDALVFKMGKTTLPTINVKMDSTFQAIDGFGFALTGGSAMHIIRMDAVARATLLKELFSTKDNNIGLSYLRVSIGASDLNDHVFSYDDLPAGETDPELKHFDLGPDKTDVIPVLKEILAINPKIKILGSPWSAPVWMKTNGDTRGGSLKPEAYKAYADYLVKYIKGMKANGIAIDAITVQNEPLHPGNNPSMVLQPEEELAFVKNNLGPAFEAAGVKTKIIIYDHNADRPDYPITILNDPGAAKYIDGSAFHLYRGEIEALSKVHAAHPDKGLYFTEQMVIDGRDSSKLKVASPVERLFIGATRNWCRNVLEWNLAADPQNQPHTDRGGCPMCQGAITIDKNKVTRNVAYYAMAHASKFVRPGSVRVASDIPAGLPNVVFKTPDNKKVLIVANTGQTAQTFNIGYGLNYATATLNAGAVATYIWQ